MAQGKAAATTQGSGPAVAAAVPHSYPLMLKSWLFLQGLSGGCEDWDPREESAPRWPVLELFEGLSRWPQGTPSFLHLPPGWETLTSKEEASIRGPGLRLA